LIRYLVGRTRLTVAVCKRLILMKKRRAGHRACEDAIV
jgi:hypothetical protein